MIGRQEAERNLNRFVGVTYQENSRDVFVKGKVILVYEKSLILQFHDGRECTISLNSINLIREVREND